MHCYRMLATGSFVISRKIVNTAIGWDVTDALANFEPPVFQSAVCQRVAFAESAAYGSAAKEIQQLTSELT